jgi:hypothetical protein
MTVKKMRPPAALHGLNERFDLGRQGDVHSDLELAFPAPICATLFPAAPAEVKLANQVACDQGALLSIRKNGSKASLDRPKVMATAGCPCPH